MTKPIARDPIYRKRAFDADIIDLCVRWYITYRLSYRDLVEMMAGLTLMNSGFWVNRVAPPNVITRPRLIHCSASVGWWRAFVQTI